MIDVRAILANPATNPAAKAALGAQLAPKKGRPRPADGMNKLERDYSRRLALQQQTGEIRWFGYEVMKVRLADRTYYNPDFLVLFTDGHFELHECKGHMEDDAAVKVKVVGEHFPIRVVIVKRFRGQWTFKTVPGLWERLGREAEVPQCLATTKSTASKK